MSNNKESMTRKEHCQYFVQRKKRYCRMSTKKGNNFCGEHIYMSIEDDTSKQKNIKDKRIPCPLDNNQ